MAYNLQTFGDTCVGMQIGADVYIHPTSPQHWNACSTYMRRSHLAEDGSPRGIQGLQEGGTQGLQLVLNEQGLNWL